MSNSQDPTLRQRHLQQQVQQRQILAMMGIGQWLQPDTVTLNIDDVTDLTKPAHIDQPAVDNPVAQSMSKQDAVDLGDINPIVSSITSSLSTGSERIANTATSYAADTVADISSDNNPSQTMPTVADVVAPIVEQTTAPVTTDAVHTAHFDDVNNTENDAVDQVAPFDLQGGRYNNWVLIVDIQALDSDSQKLWQNMTQALSLECETISFPICAGMDTPELANASLAGYIFKIGRSEESQVATLTELPVGLTHPNLVSVPSLAAMLADSTLKRQLWQQIAQ